MSQKYIEDIAEMMNESIKAEKKYDEACDNINSEDEFLKNSEFDSIDEDEINPEDVGITSEIEDESDDFYNEQEEDPMDEEISEEECGLNEEFLEEEMTQEELDEADYREAVAHCLDPIGVNASTANLKSKDTCQLSLIKEEKVKRLGKKLAKAIKESDFSSLSDDDLDKLDKIKDKIENGGEGMSGEDKKIWDNILKSMGITAKEWNAMSPEEQDKFWNESPANKPLSSFGVNGFAYPKKPTVGYLVGDLSAEEWEEYDDLLELKRKGTLTDAQKKRLQKLIDKGLKIQSGSKWNVSNDKEMSDKRLSFTDDNDIIHKIGDYEGYYEGPVPTFSPEYDWETNINNKENSNAFKRAMTTLKEIVAGSQRTEIRQKAMKNARGKDVWTLADIHSMMLGLTKEQRKALLDELIDDAKKTYGNDITSSNGQLSKTDANVILFLKTVFGEMIKDDRNASNSLTNLEDYANSWIDKRGKQPSKVGVSKYFNKIEVEIRRAFNDVYGVSTNTDAKKALATTDDAKFQEFLKVLEDRLNNLPSSQIDAQRTAKKLSAKSKK